MNKPSGYEINGILASKCVCMDVFKLQWATENDVNIVADWDGRGLETTWDRVTVYIS